ncbi:acyl transferase/acyl hydrolase/lysophospholipase [Flagelloscypha sp. PMI_526]|nr:acyl transferase/acyl hydrolase/lysophospholipase [Flagelloscypha sp. PMI_526]
MSDRGIRILVIDGEGSPSIGVVSPVRVLGEMMSRIAFDDDTTPESILPCDYFDLIVGSGDGGWLALMLGRLGMSAGRAKTIYEEIHTFVHRECASLDPTAKAEAFELRLKELICEETGQNDADLEKLQELKPTESRCNVAVLTKAALNIGAPILLRTYRVRDNQSENCPIWIAIRACTARPHIFPEANLSGQKLISASLGHNNPIESAIHEARVAFPMARIDCIISLGSGHPGHSELQSASVDSLAKAAIELSQGSEHVSQEFAKRQHAEGHGDIYFRFNVQQGLQAYAHAGYDSALAHTRAYLQDPAVGDALNAAISALRGKKQIEHPVTHPLQPTEHPTTEIIHASNAPPIQTYVHALYEEGLGLPLWDPQPLYKAKPVEVGDVGLLTKFGAFEILFNATLPAASQKTMGYRIPPGFEPIPVTSSDIKLEPQILSVPFLAHGDVIPSSQGLDRLVSWHVLQRR